MKKIIGIKDYGIIKVSTIEAVGEVYVVMVGAADHEVEKFYFDLICSNVQYEIERETVEEAYKTRDFIIAKMTDQLENIPEFNNETCSGLKDKYGRIIFVGQKIEGFNRKFIVKKGIKEIEKVSPGGDINLVMIPCIYFECIETGDALFPIVKNKDGKSDLECLEIVKEWSK